MEKLVDLGNLKIKGDYAANSQRSTVDSRVVVGTGLGCNFNTFLVPDCD
jgi:hypothetical protein